MRSCCPFYFVCKPLLCCAAPEHLWGGVRGSPSVNLVEGNLRYRRSDVRTLDGPASCDRNSRSQSRSVQERDWRLSCLSFLCLYISTQLQPAALRPSFCVRASPARPARIRVTGATGACSSAEARARDVVVANESWTQAKGKILPPSSRRLPWKDHSNDPTAACPASAKGFSAPESRFGQSGSRLGILPTGIGPAWNFRPKARL